MEHPAGIASNWYLANRSIICQIPWQRVAPQFCPHRGECGCAAGSSGGNLGAAGRTSLQRDTCYSSAFYTLWYLPKLNAVAAGMVLEETNGTRSRSEGCPWRCLLAETLRSLVSASAGYSSCLSGYSCHICHFVVFGAILIPTVSYWMIMIKEPA